MDLTREEVVATLNADKARVSSFLRRRVAPADVEDLFQQALLRATEHVDQVRDPAHLRAWFYRIVRGVLADHHARRQAHADKLALLANEPGEPTEPPPAVCRCSITQLAHVRPDYAEILRRVDLDEEPVAEVAKELGITANNATVRLHRARKALRDQVQSFCGVSSMRACLSCTCDA